MRTDSPLFYGAAEIITFYLPLILLLLPQRIVTNPTFEIIDTQNIQPSRSKIDKSTGVQASYNKNSDSEDEDYPLQASKMKDLRHPAKPIYKSETNLDETLVSEENSEEDDYRMVTGANRQLYRQSSQNLQSLNDTMRSHADKKRQK